MLLLCRHHVIILLAMKRKLIQELGNYIEETLGLSIKVDLWIGSSSLPLFLRNQYEFYEITIIDRNFLTLVDISPDEKTPGVIRRHFDYVQKNWNIDSIYVTDSMPAYNRKRLIAHKIAFIIPGNQMYLPDIGVDLREHFAATRIPRSSIILSPSTQTVILHALLCTTETTFTPSSLADNLNYSQMTMSRAFDELEAFDLGKIETKGRERVLYFDNDKKHLWESAKNNLSSPIKKRFHVRSTINHFGVRTGLTALSTYSILAEPTIPEFAISPEEWKELQNNEKVETFSVPEFDSTNITIEVWKYDPKLFAQSGVADRFSLFLSLRNQKDERVEAALNEMLENIEW